MLRYGSASSLPLFMKCTAAAVLPHVDHDLDRARECSAIHEHLQIRASHGVDEAMAAMPRITSKWKLTPSQARRVVAECTAFEWSPPAGSLGEVALCYMRDGSVQRVVGGQGRYTLPEGGLIPGTSDLIWCELNGQPIPFEWETPEQPICPEGAILWCADYKAGQDRYVDPVEWNAQQLLNTRNAARWTRAKYAVPAIIYVRPGKGDWDVPVDASGAARVLGPHDFEQLDGAIRGYIADVDEMRRRLEAGEVLDYTEGRHCTYCDAQWTCAAKTSLMRSVADGAVRLPPSDEPLTPDQASWLADRIGFLDRFVDRARELLRAHATAAGPIQLPDGDLWGEIPRTKTAIDARRALPILRETLGVAATPDETLTRAALKRMTDEVARTRGLKPGPLYGRVMRRLEDAGCVEERPAGEFGVFRPAHQKTSSAAIADIDSEIVL